MSRYARQIALAEVGEEGQRRIAEAHVLVVGAGGLGSPVIEYLAGAGVKRMILVDPDHVEESNLHRQTLYRMSDIGRSKVSAARDHIAAANPAVSVETWFGAVHPGNADGLVAGADVVVDAADSFAVSYILSDACMRTPRPLISGSALGFTGYVGGFCGGAPSLRAVFPDLPSSGATCASSGVMGPVVGMIGALQAQMVLQILLGIAPSPLGRLTRCDMTALRFGGFVFDGAPEPRVSLPFVSRADLLPDDQVVELRSMEDAPDAVSAGALRTRPEEVTDIGVVSGRRVVLCCATGLRAWRAAERLRQVGHDDLALLAMSASG